MSKGDRAFAVATKRSDEEKGRTEASALLTVTNATYGTSATFFGTREIILSRVNYFLT